MLFLNESHSIANAMKLVRAQTNQWPPADDLPRALATTLSELQGTALSVGRGIRVSFEDNPLGMKAAQQALFAGEGNQVAPLLTADERSLVARNLNHALVLIRHVNPTIHSLMELVVSDVVCVRVFGSGGGTASNLLGLIWLSPHPRWTTIDYAECLVHEFVHLNVFVADMVNRIYVDARRVREPGAQVVSAVRQERRPIDKALHSACVSATLAYFYEQLGDQSTAASFLPPLRSCVAELRLAAPTYLTSYGSALVTELEQFLAHGDVEWVTDRVSDPILADFQTDLAASQG